MLIFDGFPSREKADAFVKSVTERERLLATVYATRDESNKVDPFPHKLTPPIVLIEHCDAIIEERLTNRAQDFGGETSWEREFLLSELSHCASRSAGRSRSVTSSRAR
jgi:hypothetical protein